MRYTGAVALALLAAILLGTLASCAGAGGADGGTVSSDPPKKDDADVSAADDGTSSVYIRDSLPEGLDYGGAAVNVLAAGEWGRFSKREFTVEELTSEVVNDSIYNREKNVETRLNVEITEINGKSSIDEIRKQYTSDEDSYQIYDISVVSTGILAFEGCLTDLYSLDNLDLGQVWWFSNFSEAAGFNDELYFAAGSLSLQLMRNLFGIYFGKEMADRYSSSVPELSDLYGLVESGEWTFDRFAELGSGIYVDLNGNSEADSEDEYGINYVMTVSIDAVWSSFDIGVFRKTEDDWFELAVNTEKLFTSLEKLRVLLHETAGVFAPEVSGTTDLDDMEALFASGNTLFMVNRLMCAESPVMRNMSTDYGLLPYPKYDREQSDYYSYASDDYCALSIPMACADKEMAAAVLEAMSSYSYNETRPAYLNVAIKGKYMSDARSRHVVDLIVDGFKVDSAWIYLGSIGCDYPHKYRYLVMENDASYASLHESSRRQVNMMLTVYRGKVYGESRDR